MEDRNLISILNDCRIYSAQFSVAASIYIFKDFCQHHGIDVKTFCNQLLRVLSGYANTILLYDCGNYSGLHAVFNSLVALSNHFETVKESDCSVRIQCHDLRVAFVRLHSNITETEPSTIVHVMTDQEELGDVNDMVYHYKMSRKPYVWFDIDSLNCKMWIELLQQNCCYGCLVSHGSQLQHMGVNGCCHD